MIHNAILTIRTLLPDTGSVTREEIERQVDFVLTNPLGQEILRIKLKNSVNTISTAALKEGIYFFRIEKEGNCLETGSWVKIK